MKKYLLLSVFLLLFSQSLFAHSLSIGTGYSFQEKKAVMVKLDYDSGNRVPQRGDSVVSVSEFFGKNYTGITQLCYSNVRISHEIAQNFFFFARVGGFLKYSLPTSIAEFGWIVPGITFPLGFVYDFNGVVSLVFDLLPEFGIGFPLNREFEPFLSPLYGMPFCLSVRFNLGGGGR